MSKSPSNPVYEKKQADWARRVIARKLGINTQFMKADQQWLNIVATIENNVNRESLNANSK